MADLAESVARRFEVLRPHLSEFQRRLWLGTEAAELGSDGVAVVALATGVAADTVRRGRAEADGGVELSAGRSRKPGGGRKRAESHDPGLTAAFESLIEPVTLGDPMSPLRWTSKSIRKLTAELRAAGHLVSDSVVRRLLAEQGYSLQANVKTADGGQHPDRDQFAYLNEQARAHMAARDAVISVDAKKKELVGAYKNAGREWHPVGQPVTVKVHDFIDPALGKANPYGVDDLAHNTGWVSVGTDHDTAAFAVALCRLLVGARRPRTAPRRYPAPDQRRWRRLQRVPDQIMEDRTGRPSQANRTHHHGLPPPARHQQMEQDRTPPVLPHLDELARATTDQPRSDRRNHRRHDHHSRPHRPNRTRHQPLPDRHQDPRPTDESIGNKRHTHPTPVPPRVELHPESTATRHARITLS